MSIEAEPAGGYQAEPPAYPSVMLPGLTGSDKAEKCHFDPASLLCVFPRITIFFFFLLLLWPPLPHRSLASKDLLLCGSSSTSQELASWAWPASIPLCALQLFPILHSYPAIVSLQNQLPKASYFCLGNLFYCLITSLSGKFFLWSNLL